MCWQLLLECIGRTHVVVLKCVSVGRYIIDSCAMDWSQLGDIGGSPLGASATASTPDLEADRAAMLADVGLSMSRGDVSSRDTALRSSADLRGLAESLGAASEAARRAMFASATAARGERSTSQTLAAGGDAAADRSGASPGGAAASAGNAAVHRGGGTRAGGPAGLSAAAASFLARSGAGAGGGAGGAPQKRTGGAGVPPSGRPRDYAGVRGGAGGGIGGELGIGALGTAAALGRAMGIEPESSGAQSTAAAASGEAKTSEYKEEKGAPIVSAATDAAEFDGAAAAEAEVVEYTAVEEIPREVGRARPLGVAAPGLSSPKFPAEESYAAFLASFDNLDAGGAVPMDELLVSGKVDPVAVRVAEAKRKARRAQEAREAGATGDRGTERNGAAAAGATESSPAAAGTGDRVRMPSGHYVNADEMPGMPQSNPLAERDDGAAATPVIQPGADGSGLMGSGFGGVYADRDFEGGVARTPAEEEGGEPSLAGGSALGAAGGGDTGRWADSLTPDEVAEVRRRMAAMDAAGVEFASDSPGFPASLSALYDAADDISSSDDEEEAVGAASGGPSSAAGDEEEMVLPSGDIAGRLHAGGIVRAKACEVDNFLVDSGDERDGVAGGSPGGSADLGQLDSSSDDSESDEEFAKQAAAAAAVVAAAAAESSTEAQESSEGGSTAAGLAVRAAQAAAAAEEGVVVELLADDEVGEEFPTLAGTGRRQLAMSPIAVPDV